MLINPFNNANSTPNIYGLIPSSLKRYRTALAKTLSGQANTRVLCIGDSTTYGVYSNNTSSGDFNKYSWTSQLASLLTAKGIPANANSFMGFGAQTYQNRFSTDGRLSNFTNWNGYSTGGSGANTIGGMLAVSNTVGGTFLYTPSSPCDTYKGWGICSASNGVLGLQVESGALVTLNENGANSIVSGNATGVLGNALTVSYQSGGHVFLIGIEAYNSQAKQVCVANAGWPGAAVNDIDGNNQLSSNAFWSPLAGALAYAPDLYIVDIGINDWNATGSGITPIQYQAALLAYLTSLHAIADVILVSPAPSAISAASDAYQQQFVQAMASVASAIGIIFVDNWTRFGPYEQNTVAYYNTLHPNMIGQSDFSRPLANILSSI